MQSTELKNKIVQKQEPELNNQVKYWKYVQSSAQV